MMNPSMDGEVWFLASCVELYKDEKGLSGGEAFTYLQKNGAIRFIIECWEGLHMTAPQYIVDSIDEFIKQKDGGGIGAIAVTQPLSLSISHLRQNE